MNLNSGNPQILNTIPGGTVLNTQTTNVPNLPQVRIPVQNELDKVSSIGKSGTSMVHAPIPGPMRSTAADPFDRDLWAAGQAIATARQERVALSQALTDSNTSRAVLRKKYDQKKEEHQGLFQYYTTLYEQNKALQHEHNRVCADLAGVKVKLHDHMSLKEALAADLQKSKDELAALDKWKCQELEPRDLNIQKLQGIIQRKDSQLAHFSEKLESLEKKQLQIAGDSARDCEIKIAEISRLKAESVHREQASNEQRDRIVALSSELESAQLRIQTLEKLRDEAEKTRLNALQHHQGENDDLQESIKVNTQPGWDQTEDGVELLRNEKILLTQQLETVRVTLAAYFPDLHDEFDNLESLLAKNGEEPKRKTRRGLR